MIFYDCRTAPSPRRARMFIAEKNLNIETIAIDLAAGEQLGEDFRRINPNCTVPVLLLDDGTALTENMGIAAYLEAVHPLPALLGETPTEKGLVATWNARAELEGLYAVAECFRNRARGLRDRALTGPRNYPQNPALAERGLERSGAFLEVLDARLRGNEWLAGTRLSMADITAFVMVEFAAWIKLPVPPALTALRRWHDAVAARPSASA